MDYSYEVDLANGKTVRVTHGEKVKPFSHLLPNAISAPYSPAEWIEIAQKIPTFEDANGNTHASSAIVSVRQIHEHIDLPPIVSR